MKKEAKHLGKVKMGKDVVALHLIAYVFCGVMAIVCLVPFLMVVSGSVSSEASIADFGFSIWPHEFSWEAYGTVFKEPMVIVRAYGVTIGHFVTEAPGCAEDIMQTFFWLDEDNRNTFHLFQLVRNPGKCNVSDDKSVRYNDSDEWPAHAPVGMWIDYGLVNEFLREWCLRKEQLKSGEISEDEYFEWKINWPASSSSVDEKGNDKKNNSYKWKNRKGD